MFVSAEEQDGLAPLERALMAKVRALHPVAEIRLPVSDGRTLAELHRSGEVLDQRTDGTDLVLHARIDASLLGRLQRAGIAVTNGRTTGAA